MNQEQQKIDHPLPTIAPLFSENYVAAPTRANSAEKKEKKVRHPLDFYPTPAYATLAFLDHENFDGEIFDGSCGDGELIYACKTKFPDKKFFASDIYDYGFGRSGVDFLNLSPVPTYDNVVMNPPYGIINKFLPQALKIAKNKAAILAPLSTMEAESRFQFFKENPFTTLYIYSERITMYSRIDLIEQQYENRKLNPGVMSLGWYVWDKRATDHSKIKIIEPGRKKAYKAETAQIRNHLNKKFKEKFLCTADAVS